MKLPITIAAESDHNMVISEIDRLMSKGQENVSPEELAEIRELAIAVQAYEKQKFNL